LPAPRILKKRKGESLLEKFSHNVNPGKGFYENEKIRRESATVKQIPWMFREIKGLGKIQGTSKVSETISQAACLNA